MKKRFKKEERGREESCNNETRIKEDLKKKKERKKNPIINQTRVSPSQTQNINYLTERESSSAI